MKNIKHPEQLAKKCDFQKCLAAGGSAQRQPELLDGQINEINIKNTPKGTENIIIRINPN